MEKKRPVRKKKPKKHIVVFQDANEKVFKTVFVTDGEEAQAPEMKSVQFETMHHRIIFDGWDQDISSVHSNLVVHPIYREVPKEYLIMYFHENGKLLGSETVPYGTDARAEYTPEKEETEEFFYHFDGWSCSLKSIDGDRMAKALFRAERKTFPVRFYNDEGKLIREETVPFGQGADGPGPVNKKDDPTYYYHFDGWDISFDTVKGPLEVHPLFREEFKEYRIRLFEEDRLVTERFYHYNDPVEYPPMQKKGYDFIWHDPVDLVKETREITGSWQFSNPKGKQIEAEGCIYEITDPSVTDGSVRLISCGSPLEQIILPDRVRLGDYWYKIGSIGRKAFAGCGNARTIICSDKVEYLDKGCFSSCRRLEQVTLGKNIRKIGEAAFADCRHLHKLVMKSDRILSLDRRTFDKMNHRVTCVVPPELKTRYEKLLDRVIREKNIKIIPEL